MNEARVAAAALSARRHMQAGLLGAELRSAVLAEQPGIAAAEERAAFARVAGEYGLLGQSLHDPNLSPTCRDAAAAKARHANRDLLTLTRETPMCASCARNRAGHCGLMGGRLVASAADVPEEAVHRTAAILAERGEIGAAAARRIRTDDAPPARRLAALHRARGKDMEGARPMDEARGIRASRVAAAALEPVDTLDDALRAPPRSRTASAAAADGDDDAPRYDPSLDARVAASAAAWNGLLDGDGIDARPVLPAPRRASRPRLAAAPRIDADAAAMDSGRGAAPAEADAERFAALAAEELAETSRVARRLLAEGLVTADRAARLLGRMEACLAHGAAHDEATRRTAAQLEPLVGGFEA